MRERAPSFEQEIDRSDTPSIDIESMSREELELHAQKLEEEVEILKRRILHLERDVIHDDLTGLKTKRFFNEELQMYLGDDHESELRKEGYKHASVLFLDGDNFKRVNDTYGHNFGDQVLRMIAKTISEKVRHNDIVARWGGEEFGALLYGADEDEAYKKAEQIRAAVESLEFDSHPGFRFTMSIGVSECTSGLEFAEIMHNADIALYDAKKAGRNRVVRFSQVKKK